MPLTLYPHQVKAVQSLYTFFNGNPEGHPVLEAPTAAGKSLIQADFIGGVLGQWPGQRVLCLTHVKELVEQNYLELVGQWPMAPAGIYSAGLNRRDTHHNILFCSIQSVFRRPAELGVFDLILIDEAHLCPVKTSTGMYREFLAKMLEYNPALKIIGLTATPYRLDNGWLTHGPNALFTDVIPAKANGMDIGSLLAGGFLSPLTNEPVRTGIDTSGVKKRGGDFIPGDLAAAVDVDEITQAACDEIVHFGRDRKSWLIFATSVEHAEHIQGALLARGERSGIVTGETISAERARTIDAYKRQQLRCLINVNCLTTGFNARCVDMLAFLRPTESPALYVQMAGRGLRLSPETGKTDCLVLDFAGLIDRHGPITNVKPPKNKTGEGKGAAPVKECEACFMLIPAGARTCQYCGHVQPIDVTPAITARASTTDIMGADFGKHAVHRMTIRKHRKEGKPDSLRVDYMEGYKVVATEWVCLFHKGFIGERAKSWWRRHLGDKAVPFPVGIDEALTRATNFAACPSSIRVKQDGRYIEVVTKSFEPAPVASPTTAPGGLVFGQVAQC